MKRKILKVIVLFLVMIGLLIDHVDADEDGCQEIRDYCLVMDGSDSIHEREFKILRSIVGKLTDKLNIGRNGARLGIIVYSLLVRMNITLTDDKDALKYHASQMPHPRDATMTDLGIEAMKNQFITYGRLAEGVRSVGIVITDGISFFQDKTKKQAREVKDLGVEMIAVGVSDFIDREELNNIASSPDNVIVIQSFKELEDNLDILVRLACKQRIKVYILVGHYYTDSTPPGSVFTLPLVSYNNLFSRVRTTPPPPPITTPPPPITLPPPTPRKPCDNCKILHNVGYSAPLQCGQFTQYYFTSRGDIRSALGNCQLGQHWDQNILKCVRTINIPCPKACRPEVHIPFDRGSCRDRSGYSTYVRNHHVRVLGNGLAYFNGYSKLIIPRFRSAEFYTDLVVKMRYLEAPDNQNRGLLSDGDCCRVPHTMMVVKSPKYLHYLAICNKQTPATLHFPQRYGQWNELTYVHDTLKLEGYVNGIYAEKWANSPIRRSSAGLNIGYAKGFRNFKGYVDYITIYLCRPDFIP